MNPILVFLIIALIVGFVTAGLKIQYDRFFAIILLVTMMKLSVVGAVNVFLWIVFMGSGYLLWQNRNKIMEMPRQNLNKFLTLIPLLAFIGALAGSIFFNSVDYRVLVVTLGIIALVYGLRLVFIHFKPHEHEYKNEKSLYLKLCAIFGPIVSGFFTGFIGTTFKSIKIPFGVKVGKMNLAQTYLGNLITAFYASFFAIILHVFYVRKGLSMTLQNATLGIGLWVAIHIVYKVTDKYFKDKWRKTFQVIIGAILVLVAFKFL